MDLCQQRDVSFYYAVQVYPGVSYVFFRVKTKAVIPPPTLLDSIYPAAVTISVVELEYKTSWKE